MANQDDAISHLSKGNQRVFGVMLLTGIYVITTRLLGPLRIQWDLSIQLEAAHRFAQGLGLTNAFTPQLDLNQDPVAEQLIHFPPGFSLLVAGFIATGLPLAIALKLIYSVTTLLGWVGWSAVAARCLRGPLKLGGIALPLHLIAAAVLPLLYTPSWTIQGTDTFLWAGVPIVVLLLLSSADDRTNIVPPRGKPYLALRQLAPILLAGLVIGALTLIRYPSIFLLLTALLTIGYSWYPDLKAIALRFGAACLSCGTVVIPISLYIRWSLQASQVGNTAATNLLQTHKAEPYRAGSVTLLTSLQKAAEALISGFSNVYILTGIDMKRLGSLFDAIPIVGDLLGVFFLLGIAALWLRLLIYRRGKHSSHQIDTSVALLSTVIAFVGLAIALTFVVLYSPLVIRRYYIPVSFCLFLVAYGLATVPAFDRPIRRMALALVVFFMLYNAGLKPLDWALLDDQRDIMYSVLATDAKLNDIPYPSNAILSFHEPSLTVLTALEQQEPNALFFIQDYPLYLSYLAFENPLNVRRIPDDSFWQRAYLSEDTTLVWVINHEDCPSVCASEGNFNADRASRTLPALENLPRPEVIFAAAEDDATVMISRLEAGYQFGALGQ